MYNPDIETIKERVKHSGCDPLLKKELMSLLNFTSSLMQDTECEVRSQCPACDATNCHLFDGLNTVTCEVCGATYEVY